MCRIDSDSIDLVCTDPPYKIGRISGGGTVNTIKGFRRSLEELERAEITEGYDIRRFAKQVARVQGGNINAYFFCNKAQIPEYLKIYVEEMRCKFDILCWHKSNALPTYSNKYLSDTEYILYFRKGRGRLFPKSYEEAKTYFVEPINLADKNSWGHPTIKPQSIVSVLIKNSTEPNGVVLDPFMGSGTTAVACKSLGRNYLGFEINAKYIEVAERRLQAVQGKIF